MVFPIETERLRLVAPAPEHARDIFAYASDPRFVKHLGREPDTRISQTEAFVRSLMRDNESGERMYWCALLDGKAVGTLGFIFHGLREFREAEFGYGFSPEVWGQGIAHEAAVAVLDYGHKELGLIHFRAYTPARNIPSIRLVEKCGFTEGFTIPRFYPDDDCIVMFALRQDASTYKADSAVLG